MKTTLLLSAVMLGAQADENSLVAPTAHELVALRNRRGGDWARKVNKKNVEAGVTNKQLGVPNERPYYNQLLKRAACHTQGMVRDAAKAIKNGADLERTGNNGWTPLICASMRNNFAVAKLLATNGADVNHASNRNGRTPIWWAVDRKNRAMAKMLMTNGADPTIPDATGMTPLEKAGPVMLDIINPANMVAPPQGATGNLGQGYYDDYYTGYENYADIDTYTPPGDYDGYVDYGYDYDIPEGEMPLDGSRPSGNGQGAGSGGGSGDDSGSSGNRGIGNGNLAGNIGGGQVINNINDRRNGGNDGSDGSDGADGNTMVEAAPAEESSGIDKNMIIIGAAVGGVLILLLAAVICMRRGKKEKPKPRRLKSKEKSKKKSSKKSKSKKKGSERAEPFMNSQEHMHNGGFQEHPTNGITATNGQSPGRGLDVDYNRPTGGQWYSDNPSDDPEFRSAHRGHENYAPNPSQMPY